MKPITETADLLAFIAGLTHDIIEANSDGNISVVEIGKMVLTNLDDGIRAAKGISEVPAELADITPEELDALYGVVTAKLGWPERGYNTAWLNANWSFLRVCIEHFRVCQNLLSPPKAEPVTEP